MTSVVEVLFASSEVAPYSKVGGLADVAGALPGELARLGVDMQVISPLYSLVDRRKFGIEFTDLAGSISMGKQVYSYRVAALEKQGKSSVRHLFVHNKRLFSRPGIYTKPSGVGFNDNNARFFLFQKAIVNLITRGVLGPDVVHLNDHHTALIPLFLAVRKTYTPSLLTVHNFQYQGHFSQKELKLLGRRERDAITFSDPSQNFSFNALKIGLGSADFVNTVSVTYAKEVAQKEDLAFGLGKVIKTISPRFSGILNGADYAVWNPEIDPYLDTHYGPDHLGGKAINRTRLMDISGLPDLQGRPIIGSVSRLVPDKGYDLILEILDDLAALDVQIVFVGTGEKKIKNALRDYAKKYPRHISFFSRFDEKMAHQVEAGADMFLMPSRVEPCGLNQIYSMKYGTIPIVHSTGGLADTVQNWDGKRGNGFVFTAYNGASLLRAVKRALMTYKKEKEWTTIVKNAMKEDFSWSRSAQDYLSLYQRLVKGKS